MVIETFIIFGNSVGGHNGHDFFMTKNKVKIQIIGCYCVGCGKITDATNEYDGQSTSKFNKCFQIPTSKDVISAP